LKLGPHLRSSLHGTAKFGAGGSGSTGSTMISGSGTGSMMMIGSTGSTGSTIISGSGSGGGNTSALNSHLSPAVNSGHLHTSTFFFLLKIHLPPFSHGFGSHGFGPHFFPFFCGLNPSLHFLHFFPDTLHCLQLATLHGPGTGFFFFLPASA